MGAIKTAVIKIGTIKKHKQNWYENASDVRDWPYSNKEKTRMMPAINFNMKGSTFIEAKLCVDNQSTSSSFFRDVVDFSRGFCYNQFSFFFSSVIVWLIYIQEWVGGRLAVFQGGRGWWTNVCQQQQQQCQVVQLCHLLWHRQLQLKQQGHFRVKFHQHLQKNALH